MAKRAVNGIALNYRSEGPEGAPWVTFTTGITNDLSMWDAHVAAVTQTHRMLRFDTRAHGDSDASPEPYSLKMLIADIIGLWDGLEIERSSLVGIGLGGVVSLGLALAHPGRLEALVPVACRAETAPEFLASWPPMIEAAQAGGIEAIAEITVQRWFPDTFKSENPEILNWVRAMIRKTSLDGYLGCIAALLEMDYQSQLGTLAMPVLFVSGALDKGGAPPAVMQEMADAVPGAHHVSLPEAGHICTIANPSAFDEALASFLNR